jgi:hypothetical protein
MYDATDNLPSEDEIVEAVTRLQEHRDELLERLDSAEVALLIQQRECDELRWRLEDVEGETLVIRHMELPGGRPWSYIPDAGFLAISPDLDAATERRLRAQVQPPKLTTCDTCGAPMYVGTVCGMHDA